MNTKTVLMGCAIVIAFALFAAPLALSESASAYSSTIQKQSAYQSSVVVGFANLFSGNNLLGQFQFNR